MAIRKMKVDYNHVMEMVVDVLKHSKYAKDNGLDFGIHTGLVMIQAYMVDIAKYALEKKDERLTELLLGLCLLTEVDNG